MQGSRAVHGAEDVTFGSSTALSLYSELNIEQEITGAEISQIQGEPSQGDLPDSSPTDQLLSISVASSENQFISFGIQVGLGSYDADAIATALAESDFTESDTDGIFVGSDPRAGGTQSDVEVAVTWSEEYVISGPSVDLVQTVESTAQGQSPRLYEQTDAVARQLSGAGSGEYHTTYLSRNGALQLRESDEAFNIDYSPVTDGQLQGYTQSFSYNYDTGTGSAITVFSHPSASVVDESAFSTVGTNQSAIDRNASVDGRFVTIEASYQLPSLESSDGSGGRDGSDSESSDGSGGSDGQDGDDSESSDGSGGGDGSDSESSDGSDGQDGGDSESSDGSDSTDGSDGSGGSDGQDGGDAENSDGSGPGFGVLSAAAGIGGAGYLLKQRLSLPDDSEDSSRE